MNGNKAIQDLVPIIINMGFANLLVNLELVPAILEVCDSLFSGGNAGVEVSLGCLSAHLLGSEEYAGSEFFLEVLSGVGLDVGNVADVITRS